jgi:hypothetical protein
MLRMVGDLLLKENGHSLPAESGVCARHAQPASPVYARFEISHAHKIRATPSEEESISVNDAS